MKEEWLFPGAIVSVDVETTSALVAEIKRLIDVVGGMALGMALAQPSMTDLRQAELPPEWPLIKNILAEYGLDAISFVAGFQAAQRRLTDEDWEHIDNKKGTALDTFAQGAVWAADQLKERNNG